MLGGAGVTKILLLQKPWHHRVMQKFSQTAADVRAITLIVQVPNTHIIHQNYYLNPRNLITVYLDPLGKRIMDYGQSVS